MSLDLSCDRSVETAVATLLQSIVLATDGAPQTTFDATAVPSMPLEAYVGRLFRYAQCSPACFVAALIYLDRLIASGLAPLTSRNVHKLTLVGLVTAVKVHEDARLSNADFAYLGGTTTAELNRIEVLFLFSVKFDLHISPETYSHFSRRLTAFIQKTRVFRPLPSSPPLAPSEARRV